MMIAPKRPEYKVGIVCNKCNKPWPTKCECEFTDEWSRSDDAYLDSPTHGQAKENNRKIER